MNIYGEFLGKKPIVIPVPVLTPKLSSYWLYFVTSVPATTAMSLVEGLAHDYIGEDHEMRELVPQRLLSFRESVAVTLAAEKNHDLPVWGLLYWYAHLPLYGPLVHGAVAEIARRAELLEGPRAAV